LLDAIRSHVLALPDLVKFAIVIAIMAGVPRLAVRIRLPAMVGLLLFGVALGAHVLGSSADRPGADFYAGPGKLLPLFSAGLEIGLRPRPELDHVLRAGGGLGQ
jgi:Kef-type K+ transport system membrane component KefB